MPVATPEQYEAMLDRAKKGGYAYPAVNVSSSQTLNAALQGFSEAESDGIIQISFGGADYLAGHTVKNRKGGSIAFAKYAEEVAKAHNVLVALHTDHCPKEHLESFVLPLLEESEKRVSEGGYPLFQSHMWDGSAIPLQENLEIAAKLLPRCAAAGIVLEVEIGVVGGEEDGISHEINDQLYTTLEDAVQTVEALGLGEQGRYMTALTFGNVHGVYKPGNVRLRPELLAEIQAGLQSRYATAPLPLDLVFHGGSGSTGAEIAEAVKNGVIKMNIDTDTQYAFTRPVTDFMFKNYDGVLKIDGEVGNKKSYDPRAYGKAAEAGMAARIVQAAKQLGSAGKSPTATGKCE